MTTLATVRNLQLEQLPRGIKIVHRIIDAAPREDCTTYRDSGEGWTVLQVVCHLRDFENIFLQRARMTIEQNLPDLPFPNPDQLAVERKYHEQDLDEAYAEWARSREAMLTYYSKRSEDHWERLATHPARGRISLLEQLCIHVSHDNNHTEQITRILAEKRS